MGGVNDMTRLTFEFNNADTGAIATVIEWTLAAIRPHKEALRQHAHRYIVAAPRSTAGKANIGCEAKRGAPRTAEYFRIGCSTICR